MKGLTRKTYSKKLGIFLYARIAGHNCLCTDLNIIQSLAKNADVLYTGNCPYTSHSVPLFPHYTLDLAENATSAPWTAETYRVSNGLSGHMWLNEHIDSAVLFTETQRPYHTVTYPSSVLFSMTKVCNEKNKVLTRGIFQRMVNIIHSDLLNTERCLKHSRSHGGRWDMFVSCRNCGCEALLVLGHWH